MLRQTLLRHAVAERRLNSSAPPGPDGTTTSRQGLTGQLCGYFFAVDIGQGCSLIGGQWKNCSSTGVVASNVRIPEPGTMGLTLTAVAGLAGLVMLQRRRKLAHAA